MIKGVDEHIGYKCFVEDGVLHDYLYTCGIVSRVIAVISVIAT